MRMLVCVPSFDGTVKSKTAESLGNAVEYAREHNWSLDNDGVVYRFPRGYDIARARNFMARWAIDEKADHLLMVDSDIVLPHDAIYNMLEDDVDVVLGFYVHGRSHDGRTTMVKYGAADNSNTYTIAEFEELRKSGKDIVEVKYGGMGCALVETSVFGRIQKPWFYYQDNPDGSGFSEDYWFCRQCTGARIKVHVDTRVGCGHIKDRTLEAM